MNISAIRTPRLEPGTANLESLLDDSLSDIQEGSIVVVTSKVVSICEGSVVAFDATDKDTLIAQEADLYLPAGIAPHGYHYSIIHNTLVSSAGIDESNGGGYFVLWPRNPQQAANDIRQYLAKRFSLKNVGVIITDSVSQPLRRGTIGVAIAHSGFKALRNYVGKPDLFGRPFGVTQSNVAGGLAAAAVVAMGEGTERTPLVVISDIPFVDFQEHDPTEAELQEVYVSLKDDLFAPFLTSLEWHRGDRGSN